MLIKNGQYICPGQLYLSCCKLFSCCKYLLFEFVLKWSFHLALVIYSYKKDMYLFLLSDMSVYTVFCFDWKKII